ncbi:MAG: ROK family protein [Deltaproteobacteria bacterium]|nr:MAG: ROK family protein [Deltaproteobacteria bacterium]
MMIVGVDLGGTQLRVRMCRADKTLLAERKTLLEDRSPDAVVALLAELVAEMQEENNLQKFSLTVSCAVAGMLDKTGRIVRNAPNLKWREEPFADNIQSTIEEAQHVVLWNDLDAATWGEYKSGEGQGLSEVAAVFVGSGVGGGLVLGGRPFRGGSGVSAEVGHLKYRPEGRSCGCGARGCVEAYAGGHSLARIAEEVAANGSSPFLQERASNKGEQPLSAADIAAGVEANDPVCKEIFEQAGDALGWALSHLLTIINPESIILGGGVLLNWPALAELAKERALHYTSTPAGEAVSFVTSQLGNEAGMVGAVELADTITQK